MRVGGQTLLFHCGRGVLQPAIQPGQDDEWRALAVSGFDGGVELGVDLHRVETHAPR